MVGCLLLCGFDGVVVLFERGGGEPCRDRVEGVGDFRYLFGNLLDVSQVEGCRADPDHLVEGGGPGLADQAGQFSQPCLGLFAAMLPGNGGVDRVRLPKEIAADQHRVFPSVGFVPPRVPDLLEIGCGGLKVSGELSPPERFVVDFPVKVRWCRLRTELG